MQSILIDGTFFFSGSSAKALLTTLQLEIHVFLKPSLHCFRLATTYICLVYVAASVRLYPLDDYGGTFPEMKENGSFSNSFVMG